MEDAKSECINFFVCGARGEMPRRTKRQQHLIRARAMIARAGRQRGVVVHPPQPPDDVRNQPTLAHGCVCCEQPPQRSPRLCRPQRKRRRQVYSETDTDTAHQHTEAETTWAAVSELQISRAVAKATKTRVHGADVKNIAKKLNVTPRHLRRLAHWSRFRSLFRRPGSGKRKSATSREMQEWLLQKSHELGGTWTTRMMANCMRERWGYGSPGSVWRLAHALGFRLVYQRSRPLLNAEAKRRRLAWATEQLSNGEPFKEPGTVYVHVDEKWFLCPTAQTAMLGRSKGETTGGHTCEQDPHHQGHVPRRSRSTKPGAQLRRSNRVVPHCRSSSSTTTEQAPQQGRPSLEAGQHGRRLVQGVHEGTCG